MNSTYMLGAAILLGGPVAAQQSQADGQKPNVIFIYADDLGYGDLECYGATRVQTPHVNRLANEGIRVSTCPSRLTAGLTPSISTTNRKRANFLCGLQSAVSVMSIPWQEAAMAVLRDMRQD